MSQRSRTSVRRAGRLVPPAIPVRALAIILTFGGMAGRATADERPSKVAVERARGSVLKLECCARSADEIPTVLSAVAWDDDGYLVTVGLRAASGRRIRVNDCTGRKFEAHWVATDDYSGLTVLKLEGATAQPPELVSSVPEIGSSVLVVGNPFGLSHSVSVGVVSGLDRTVSFSGGVGRGMIQFTAPVFPGDGGGLLADYDGKMLGLVATSLTDPMVPESPDRRIVGIGFAIPVAELRGIVRRLRAGQRVERGYLGLTAEDVEPTGVRVASVFKDSPAQQAGVLVGDLVEAIDGQPVVDFDNLAGRIERAQPGSSITLSIRRGGEPITVRTTLADRPLASGARRSPAPELNPLGAYVLRNIDSSGRADLQLDPEGTVLGIHTQPVTESLAKSLGLTDRDGALVGSIVAGSPAERSGLKVSDVIIRWNDEPVKSPQQLRARIRKIESGTPVRLGIVRDGSNVTVQVTVTVTEPGIAKHELQRWPGTVLWSSEWQRSRLEAMEERVLKLEAELNEIRKQRDTNQSEKRQPDK